MLLILDVDVALGASFRLAKLDGRAGISLDLAPEDLDIEVNALDTIFSILLDRVFKQIYCATLVFKWTALQWVLIGHGFVQACRGHHFQEVRLVLTRLARAICAVCIVLDELGLIRQILGLVE